MTEALHVHVHVSPPIPTAVTDLPPDLDVRVWSPIATTLIGGEREAVLVDPPLTVDQSAAVVERVLAWGRELTTIYVTHAHGDHWFGAAALLEHFPAARVVALPAIAERARRQTPEDVAAFWGPRFPGGQIPTTLVAPEPMDGDVLELEGHELVAVGLGHTDTDDTSCLHVPSLGLVVAGDAVYEGVHLYLAESPAAGRQAWRDALDVVRGLRPTSVIAGHQRPGATGDPVAIDETRRYLDDVEELAATTSSRSSCTGRCAPATPTASTRAPCGARPAPCSRRRSPHDHRHGRARRHRRLQAAHRDDRAAGDRLGQHDLPRRRREPRPDLVLHRGGPQAADGVAVDAAALDGRAEGHLHQHPGHRRVRDQPGVVPQAHQMHRTAHEFPTEVDEFEAVGLEKVPSEVVAPPRVRDAPVHFECRLDRIIPVGDLDDHVVWGVVERVHVRDDLYLDRGRIDTAALAPVGRLAAEYTLVENVFTTPLDDDVLDVRGGRMRRLDEQDPEFSPIDTDAWSPSGSVRTES